MLQQAETNSIHDLDEINDEIYDNRTQIPFPTGYFGSRQMLEFLLCESCFFGEHRILLIQKKGISPHAPCCNDFRLESIPILDSEIYKFTYDSKRGIINDIV